MYRCHSRYHESSTSRTETNQCCPLARLFFSYMKAWIFCRTQQKPAPLPRLLLSLNVFLRVRDLLHWQRPPPRRMHRHRRGFKATLFRIRDRTVTVFDDAYDGACCGPRPRGLHMSPTTTFSRITDCERLVPFHLRRSTVTGLPSPRSIGGMATATATALSASPPSVTGNSPWSTSSCPVLHPSKCKIRMPSISPNFFLFYLLSHDSFTDHFLILIFYTQRPPLPGSRWQVL